jgi:hypothetical protein
MSDTEWIYSLYIQANPVPDPSLLSETPAESPVVVRDPHPTAAPPRSLRRTANQRPRWAAAAGVFVVAILIVAAVGLFGLLGNNRSEVVVVPPPLPTISFDGESAAYAGPETFDRTTLTFLLENTSGEMAGLGWNVLDDESITFADEIAWTETHRGDAYEIPAWVREYGPIVNFHTNGTWEGSAEIPEGEVLLYVWQPGPKILYPAAHIRVDTGG